MADWQPGGSRQQSPEQAPGDSAARGSGRPRRAALPIKMGAFDVHKAGLARFDWRDPYHLALTLSWRRFFAVMLALELLINSVFACLYLLQPGSVAHARPGAFEDAFFFSLETLATVGYGVMAPATLYGHMVSAIEIVTGVAFTAVLTGLVFGRFSRPKAKILFADQAVICLDDGIPTLMVRIGNGRPTLLSDAEASITALVIETTAEGMPLRRPRDLALRLSRFPLFALTWTLMHRLDESSPLFGASAEMFAASQLRLFVSVRAWDVTLAAQVRDLHAYPHEAIRFRMRYQDAVSWDETGHTLADLGKLSLIEPDLPHAHAS